jgi:hypothetical protein
MSRNNASNPHDREPGIRHDGHLHWQKTGGDERQLANRFRYQTGDDQRVSIEVLAEKT